MNPILDRKYFIPDVEARVMPDGRLYLYGSQDILGSATYCNKEYRVFSCGGERPENFVCHGVSFANTADKPGVPFAPDIELYAPDAIYKDGKYYLYFCCPGGIEGVAVSDSPSGPFTDARSIPGANGDGIDPAVFNDDDGQAYYFWGQFNLSGARLNDDMKTLDLSTLKRNIITERRHGFHEGASIRKRGGIYYMVYTDISRGKATCLGYATSKAPLGPYEKRGIIIDNMYCDPETWNDHGSIECYNGRWYVFYHRATQRNSYTRRVCAEPIYFNADGTINEVEMTSNGCSAPLDAKALIPSSCACRMKGNVYIKTESDGTECLDNCGGGSWTDDWAEYKYLDFGVRAARCTIRARGKGIITLKTADSDCGSVTIDSADFAAYTFDVTSLSGILPVWFAFNGRGISFLDFKFE